MVEGHCGLETTFSKPFLSQNEADQAIQGLSFTLGESVVAKAVPQKDGTIIVEATFKCRAWKYGERIEGSCLLESLDETGLSFPQDLKAQCLKQSLIEKSST